MFKSKYTICHIAIILIGLMSVADGFLTLWASSATNFVEMNPIFNYLIEHLGIANAIWTKIIVTIIVCIGTAYSIDKTRPAVHNVCITATFSIYLALSLYWIYIVLSGSCHFAS